MDRQNPQSVHSIFIASTDSNITHVTTVHYNTPLCRCYTNTSMHDSCTSGPHSTSAECRHQQAMSIEHQNTFFPIQLFPVWHMTCHNVLQNGRIKRECHIIHTEMQVPLSTFGTPVSSVGIEGSVTLLKKVISRSSRFHVLLITSTK